jgi:hypothetical protein
MYGALEFRTLDLYQKWLKDIEGFIDEIIAVAYSPKGTILVTYKRKK